MGLLCIKMDGIAVERVSVFWRPLQRVANLDPTTGDHSRGDAAMSLHGIESAWPQFLFHKLAGIAQTGGFQYGLADGETFVQKRQ